MGRMHRVRSVSETLVRECPAEFRKRRRPVSGLFGANEMGVARWNGPEPSGHRAVRWDPNFASELLRDAGIRPYAASNPFYTGVSGARACSDRWIARSRLIGARDGGIGRPACLTSVGRPGSGRATRRGQDRGWWCQWQGDGAQATRRARGLPEVETGVEQARVGQEALDRLIWEALDRSQAPTLAPTLEGVQRIYRSDRGALLVPRLGDHAGLHAQMLGEETKMAQ